MIFETLITQPIYNALIFCYNLFGDMGLAIIAITLLVRLILLPLGNKAFRAQRRLQALQPKLKKLQDKHKDDREVMAKEVMAFYKKEGISPAASCLPTVVQIPILIALFIVFQDAVKGHPIPLYSFVHDPGAIDPNMFGILDLSQRDPSFVLPALAGGFQYLQSRMLMAQVTGQQAAIQKQMGIFLPLITFVFACTLPAALPLYWAVSTLFMVGQQYKIIQEMPLAQTEKEAAAEWNEANPTDPVEVPQRGRKAKGPKVTVRKRK